MGRESNITKVSSVDDNTIYRIVLETGESRNILGSVLKAYLGEGTATPFIEIVGEGDDTGLICTEQWAVGKPASPKESVFGEGDSYGVGLEDGVGSTLKLGSAWHFNYANLSGLNITGATDVTEILSSDSGSATPLFNGVGAGSALLIGSDYTYGGAKVKIDSLGSVEPQNVIAEYLKDNSPSWITTPYMVTDADFPYSQKGWSIASCSSCSEQWRFGFDRDDLPTTWSKVTLNINGTDYTKYWAIFRVVSPITTDPVIEQIKLHTNRFEINKDGSTEYFGRSRYPKVLFFGVQNLINNTISSPASQDVTYESGEAVADYTDNQFNNNTIDSAIITQAIVSGLDTSIPIYLDISFYIEGIATGDVEWVADVYKVSDGFLYDGSATPDTFSVIAPIITPSNLERKTATIKILANDLTDQDSILIRIKRDATAGNPNDTVEDECVITQIKLTGYFWRP
jgi:hypothetical protein